MSLKKPKTAQIPPQKKIKAAQIPPQKMMRIAKFAEKNPSISLYSIADEFSCTYNQVTYAIKQYKLGKLHKTKPRVKKGDTAKALEEKTADEMLESQFEECIASLHCELDMGTSERVQLLTKMFEMRKSLQQYKLDKHIKRADSALITTIIRKFMPEANDDEIVKIYREALELCKK